MFDLKVFYYKACDLIDWLIVCGTTIDGLSLESLSIYLTKLSLDLSIMQVVTFLNNVLKIYLILSQQ